MWEFLCFFSLCSKPFHPKAADQPITNRFPLAHNHHRLAHNGRLLALQTAAAWGEMDGKRGWETTATFGFGALFQPLIRHSVGRKRGKQIREHVVHRLFWAAFVNTAVGPDSQHIAIRHSLLHFEPFLCDDSRVHPPTHSGCRRRPKSPPKPAGCAASCLLEAAGCRQSLCQSAAPTLILHAWNGGAGCPPVGEGGRVRKTAEGWRGGGAGLPPITQGKLLSLGESGTVVRHEGRAQKYPVWVRLAEHYPGNGPR